MPQQFSCIATYSTGFTNLEPVALCTPAAISCCLGRKKSIKWARIALERSPGSAESDNGKVQKVSTVALQSSAFCRLEMGLQTCSLVEHSLLKLEKASMSWPLWWTVSASIADAYNFLSSNPAWLGISPGFASRHRLLCLLLSCQYPWSSHRKCPSCICPVPDSLRSNNICLSHRTLCWTQP